MSGDLSHHLFESPDTVAVAGDLIVEVAGAWAQVTCSACGQSVSFVNPRPERMAWFTTSHRCGPPASTWQGGT